MYNSNKFANMALITLFSIKCVVKFTTVVTSKRYSTAPSDDKIGSA